MPETFPDDQVVTIDCQYITPQRAAAFLIGSGDHAAFIDNNTHAAVPLLLQALRDHALRPEQVQYLIITHVHLDHCGGTAALLAACPNATVLAHPRAVRHLVDPTRLIAGTIAVYGEANFLKLYGGIAPVPAERIRAVADGERIDLGRRALTFLHTRGHANHHFVIHDSGSGSVFTGDSFGIAYPKLQYGVSPMIICSSTPTEFDAKEAFVSVDKILATAPSRVYLSHFGVFDNPGECAVPLRESIGDLQAILLAAVETDLEDDALQARCETRVRADVFDAARRCGLRLSPDEVNQFEFDTVMNARGLAFGAARLRRGATRPVAS